MLKRSSKRQKTVHSRPDESESDGLNDVRSGGRALGDERVIENDEKTLEHVVLGGDTDIVEHLGRKSTTDTRQHGPHRPQPAWEDEDDEDVKVTITKKDYRHQYFKHQEHQKLSSDQYQDVLKSQFEKVTGQPQWAKLAWEKPEQQLSSDEENDHDPEAKRLLQSTGNYLAESESLPQYNIRIKSCTDANKEQPSQSRLLAMEFHPSSQVMLTGGPNHTLALFQIDGKTNPKIQSLYLERYPIYCAHFHCDGTEVILGSMYNRFKYYDMMGGQVHTVPQIKGIHEQQLKHFVLSPDGKYIVFRGGYGQMHLLSAKSKEWIHTFKMNGSVEAVDFSPDSSKMFSHGDDGEVYVWDMTTRDCVHHFTDEGCVKGTNVAVSKNGQYVATGCSSGIVNIYDQSCLSESKPSPLKAVKNLKTPCSNIVFNSTSEILAIASNDSLNGVKLVHMSSLTTFANFPERTDNIVYPCCLDFSVNSGYFAIGNNKGQALLYRLKHYTNY